MSLKRTSAETYYVIRGYIESREEMDLLAKVLEGATIYEELNLDTGEQEPQLYFPVFTGRSGTFSASLRAGMEGSILLCTSFRIGSRVDLTVFTGARSDQGEDREGAQGSEREVSGLLGGNAS